MPKTPFSFCGYKLIPLLRGSPDRRTPEPCTACGFKAAAIVVPTGAGDAAAAGSHSVDGTGFFYAVGCARLGQHRRGFKPGEDAALQEAAFWRNALCPNAGRDLPIIPDGLDDAQGPGGMSQKG